METVWFILVAVVLTTYVVLDGFDLGAGVAQLVVARTEEERRMVLRAVGPFWDGNEVWLLAAGGTLVFAFPALYASSFSGFFLPLMIVLWLFMGRGIALEFREHVADRMWRSFWDTVFAVSSGLLAFFLGAALGNVVRGVPLDKEGVFFEPLFTHFGVHGQTGIVDWYTLLVGALALVVLAMHGGLWLVFKTGGELRQRAQAWARRLWWAAAGLTVVVCVATYRVQPQVRRQLADHPWGHAFSLLALFGLAGALWYGRDGRAGRSDLWAFLASSALIAGLLGATAFGVYPYVLPSNSDPAMGLTVHGAAAPEAGLHTALLWWIPGMLLAAGYVVFNYRRFSGRVEG